MYNPNLYGNGFTYPSLTNPQPMTTQEIIRVHGEDGAGLMH